MEKNTDTTGNGPASGRGFEKLFKEDGKYYFQYRDSDGEAILFSRAYQSERSRDNGIKAVIRAAGMEEQYEDKEGKKGKHYFILKSGNHQEIARSRLFDAREEMMMKRAEVGTIKKGVPIFDRTQPAEPVEEKAPVEEPVKPMVEAPAAVEKAAPKKPESSGKMPRYKFSIIYYPDSEIWMIKHDFSGNSRQLKTCDGAQIAAFLQSQLPAKKVEVAKEPPAKKPGVTPGIPLPKEIQLKIENYHGGVVQKNAQPGNLKSIELTAQMEKGAQDQVFEGEIVARSLESNQTTVIAQVPKQWSKQGRLKIPIQRANYLMPGLYLFIANIHQSGGGKPEQYYGSQLVVMN